MSPTDVQNSVLNKLAPAAPPPTQVDPFSQAYGAGASPFDASYDPEVQRLKNFYAQLNNQYGSGNTDINNAYTTGVSDLGFNNDTVMKRLANQFSDQGTTYSSANINAQGDQAANYQKGLQSLLESKARGISGIQGTYDAQVQSIMDQINSLNGQRSGIQAGMQSQQALQTAQANALQQAQERQSEQINHANAQNKLQQDQAHALQVKEASLQWRDQSTNALWRHLGGNPQGTGTIGNGATLQDVANNLANAVTKINTGQTLSGDEQYWFDMAERYYGKAPRL